MDNNDELKGFIQETLRQIDEGIGEEHEVKDGLVEFDVAISKIVEKGGKVGVTVLGQGVKGGAEVKDEKISRVKFSARMRRKSEQKRWDEQMERANRANQNQGNWNI